MDGMIFIWRIRCRRTNFEIDVYISIEEIDGVRVQRGKEEDKRYVLIEPNQLSASCVSQATTEQMTC